MGEHADDYLNESVDTYWGDAYSEECEVCGGGPGWHYGGCSEAT